MNDWLNPNNLIALYGAFLSTAILIWQLIEKRNQNKGKIKVKMYLNYIALTFPGRIGEWTPQLSFDIVNSGKNERVLTSAPRLEVKTPEQKYFLSLIQPNPLIPVHYPKRMEHGEKFECHFPLEDIMNELRKANVRKLRGYLTDTLGKHYYSEWIKIETMKDYLSQHQSKE